MNSKIKILYIVSTLKKSGPTNQLSYIIKYLDKNKFEPIILTLSPESQNSDLEKFVEMSVKIEKIESTRIGMEIKGYKKLMELVDRLKPNIIHSCGIRADKYTNKYLKNYLKCSTIRNYAFEDYPNKFGKFKGLIMAYNHIMIINAMKNPVSCSSSIANILKRNHKITTDVVCNGVDCDYYKPVDENIKKSIRKSLLLDSDKVIFLSVGALNERKDPISLINAFNMANISEKAQLVFLGEGELYSKCKDMNIKSVEFRGQVSNVLDYLRTCDIFVSSSKSEGLPNSVLEAMSVGKPVILSDIEPHKEILLKNNKAGSLYKIEDLEQLSCHMKKYTESNLCQNEIEARKTVEFNFSAEYMSKSYQNLYERILKFS